MNKVITLSRQYGSGGREIGKRLAEQLEVPFYDKGIITRAAKESGFAEETFEKAEEKATNSLLYSIAMGMNVYGNQELGFPNLSLDDRVFLAQSDVIRKVADEGPCVIVGRCSDYILNNRPNVVHIFIWADLDSRIERATTLYGMPTKKAKENILKIDKSRGNYYSYHANERWGKVENYHLSIKSNYLGIDNAVKYIRQFVEMGEIDEIKR